jgi:hypothetical protein
MTSHRSRLELTADTTVVLDARLARDADVRVPGQALDLGRMQAVYLDFTEVGTPDRMITVRASHRARADQSYLKRAFGTLPDLEIDTEDVASAVYQGAFSRTEHYIGDGFVWTPVLEQLGEIEGETAAITEQGFVRGRYQPGRTFVETWNRAPFGAAFSVDVQLGAHRGR